MDRFELADPVQFRAGDIVEVQATVVAIPLKNKKFKMITQLRSVALITGSFTEARYLNAKSGNKR